MIDEVHQQIIDLNRQVVECYEDGQYKEALVIAQQASALARQHFAWDDTELALTLSNLASVYEAVGMYEQAEPLYQEALSIWRMQSEVNHTQLGVALNNLAFLYFSMGNYSVAEPLYQEALRLWRLEHGEVHSLVAVCLNNLGLIYQALRNYPTAESLLQQALEVRRQLEDGRGLQVARSLNNLGTLYRDQGRFADAESLLREALQAQRENLSHPEVASLLNNLATVLRAQGRYDEAIKLYQDAITVARTVLGDQHPFLASFINNQALLCKMVGEYPAAESLYLQSLEMRRSTLGWEHPDIAGSLYNLAMLSVVQKRPDEALALMQEAAHIHDQLTGQLFSIGTEKQRMIYLAAIRTYLHGFLSLVQGQLSHSLPAIQAALDLVLRRKAISVEALAVQRDAILGGRYPELVPKLHDLSQLRMRLVQQTIAGPGPESAQVHHQQLQELAQQREQLEAELAHAIPEMNLAVQFRTVTREAVANKLPPDSALVEFVSFDTLDFAARPTQGEQTWKETRYVAFVMLAGDPEHVHLIDLGEAEPLDALIEQFRASLLGEQEEHTARHVLYEPCLATSDSLIVRGNQLRERIFDPLLQVLGPCKRLFVAPDSHIARLPLEVLPLEQARFVIDDYDLTYLDTGRDILRFAVSSHGTASLPLVIADPNFDLKVEVSPESPARPPLSVTRGMIERDLRSLSFLRLEGTRIEGEQIAQMLGVEPLMGDDALEARLKGSRSPRLLHLATHGFFIAQHFSLPRPDLLFEESENRFERFFNQHIENPLLRSGLALAGVNTWSKGGNLPVEAEDGLLTAEDVTALDLLDTECVVLSACETGLGDVQAGEGIFGLRRAFLVAGARAVLVSLWRVPDRETQELMGDFYGRILAHQPRGAALRQAQLQLKQRHPHPRIWGAFICQGDPGRWVR